MDTSLEEIVARDLPEFHSILNDLQVHLKESTMGITRLHEIVRNGNDREKGLSYLEMKSHLFLEYLINLTYSMLLKINGNELSGQLCIEHLVEIRTTLGKIRPIDKKLKYQIDKLVKMASKDVNSGEKNVLSYKPNIDNLAGNDDESNAESDADEEEKKDGVYVPPKVTAVPYEEDNKLSRQEKKLEKARQRSLNSNLLADMREEFGDEPEEISDGRNRYLQAKYKQRENEREQFEESNLRRLTLNKKEKNMKRKVNELDEIVKIGKFNSLDNEESDDEDDKFTPKFKKKKGKRFGGGSKGKFKKRMQRSRK